MYRHKIFSKILAWTTLLSMIMTISWPGSVAFGFTETSRSRSEEPIAEGVLIERIKIQTTEGALNTYVMKIDLTNQYVRVDTLVGTKDVITTSQGVSKMAKEAGAVAAINGDFFQMDAKAPIGLTVQSGALVTSPAQRTDMYGFGLTKSNLPVFNIFTFQGTVTSPGGLQHQLFGINKPAYLADKGASSDINRLNLYTPRWGTKSRGSISGLTGVVEMVVENDLVREIRVDQPGLTIPANGYVISGHGTAGQYLKSNFKLEDAVQVSYTVAPENDNLQAAIGGQALLVKNGQRHWFSQNITGKRARTAIGASEDGKTLYLVVVEGGTTSRGMTQEELADFMISVGAWTAINHDGGGSSAMVARQLGDESVSLLNSPAAGSERAVPTALGIFSTAPLGEFAGIKVSGPQAILVGTKKAYSVKGYDVHFNPYSVEPGDVTWEISPELGNFEGNILMAVKSGDGIVKASYNGVSQEYPITILGSNDISKIEITPTVIALNPTESVTINVKVTTRKGHVFTLQPGEYGVEVKGDLGTVNGSIFKAGDQMASGELVVRVDSTMASAKVSVGGIDKPFYGFETAKIVKFKGNPAEQVLGEFRFTTVDESTFRGAGAARLEYDFTKTSKIRLAYGNFEGGMALPGQPLGLSLWVLGDGGNGHWLRARIVDNAGKERLLDLSKSVNWTGWKQVTANIPNDVKLPVTLTDIYLVEIEGGSQDKGVIYFDELSLAMAPTADDLAKKAPEVLSIVKDVLPGTLTTIKLGDKTAFSFNSPVDVPGYKVTANQLWSIDLPTPGYNPVMPVYELKDSANGDEFKKLAGPMKIELDISGTKNPEKLRLMAWDKAKSTWQPIPSLFLPDKGTITAKAYQVEVMCLMENARPNPVFSDTASSWAKEIIGEMAAKKIVNGYPDGKFMPAKGVTRAEFITLLANTLGWTSETTGVRFNDALPTWAEGSISTAVNRGVVKGYNDGTFQPRKVITRAEMAVMIDKALGLADSSQPSNYADAREIPAWAVQSIRNTKVSGLMQGSNNAFRPKDVANRAEATAVMAKLMEYYLRN